MATRQRSTTGKGAVLEARARTIAEQVLGLPRQRDAAVVIRAVDRGFESAAVTRLAKVMRVSEGAVLEVVAIPRSTFTRRKKEAKRLTSDESDRLYRLTRLLERAVTVLGDEDEARSWISAPKRAFGGVSPLIMARTDVGAREVEDLLGRIEYGIPS